MLEAARKHEVDLIITKSLSRFCRNTDILLKTVRELKKLGVGVLFELQHIDTEGVRRSSARSTCGIHAGRE